MDNDEEVVLHSKNDDIEIMRNDTADEMIEERVDSLRNSYQNNLELTKGSEFFFDYRNLL